MLLQLFGVLLIQILKSRPLGCCITELETATSIAINDPNTSSCFSAQKYSKSNFTPYVCKIIMLFGSYSDCPESHTTVWLMNLQETSLCCFFC